MRALVSFISLLGISACGPAGRRDDNGSVGVDASTSGPEVCDDGTDNDNDGRSDCSDVDCSGVGDCPVCGNVENPEAAPLELPDGVSSGTTCSTDAQCTSAVAPNCVAKECHGSYASTLNFIGFGQNAKLTDPSKLLKICVNMEHSWLRDLQVELITPDGTVFILNMWYDRTTVEEIYLGTPNDQDDAGAPVAGTGMEYCWTPSATSEMINSMTGAVAPTTMMSGLKKVLAPGDYKSATPWPALTGTSLNGMWTMRVTDLWEVDNGFMFSWSISFDPSLVTDCGEPIIL